MITQVVKTQANLFCVYDVIKSKVANYKLVINNKSTNPPAKGEQVFFNKIETCRGDKSNNQKHHCNIKNNNLIVLKVTVYIVLLVIGF